MPDSSLTLPRFPMPLAIPLGLIPARVHSTALVLVLNQIFARPLREGELDFLEGRMVEIRIPDARVTLRLTLRGGRLEAGPSKGPADTQIEGSAFDFLCLATRQEDADTLFFNRRLRFAGDTELGLYVKNFLDGFEPPGELAAILAGVGGLVRRFAG
jgi:predicted lipid carrier protein YhbT